MRTAASGHRRASRQSTQANGAFPTGAGASVPELGTSMLDDELGRADQQELDHMGSLPMIGAGSTSGRGGGHEPEVAEARELGGGAVLGGPLQAGAQRTNLRGRRGLMAASADPIEGEHEVADGQGATGHAGLARGWGPRGVQRARRGGGSGRQRNQPRWVAGAGPDLADLAMGAMSGRLPGYARSLTNEQVKVARWHP